jgi:PPOX class probable F420-dependent enzyme
MNATTLSDQAKAMLREPYFAWATVIRPDGSPHCTIVCVDVDGDEVVFTTAVGRVKERILRTDGRVAVSVLDPAVPFHSLTVSGTGRIEEKGAEEMTDRIARKYWGAADYAHRSRDERRVTVRVTPERVIYSDAGGGGRP